MKSIVIEEYKKIDREKSIIPTMLGMIVVSLLISYLLYRIADIGNIEAWYGQTGKLYASFLDIYTVFVTFFAMAISYYLLTKEYVNETWELLIVKLFRRERIIYAKYIVFMSYYMLFAFLFCIMSTGLIFFFIPHEPNIKLYIIMAVMGFLMCIFYATLQFCIQLMSGHFVLTLIVGIVYRFIEGMIPYDIPILKYTPISSFSYLINENLFFNYGLLGCLCIINVLCSFILVCFLGKRFYL